MNTYTTGDEMFPGAAIDESGNFAIVWQRREPFLRNFDGNGTAGGPEAAVAPAATGPISVPRAASNSAGDFVVAWQAVEGGGGAFCVAQNVTRAEMARFVARGLVAPLGDSAIPLTVPGILGEPIYSCDPGIPGYTGFTDVAATDSFCKHVYLLGVSGIVSGCTATEYCPAEHVTRGEMAKFLSKAFAPNLYGP